MPKICQCQEKKITDILEDVCENGWCRNDVNALFRIIESDCVCEKKEEVRTPSDKCLHGYLLTEPCKHCYFDAKYSKYACKHGIVSFGTVETICNYCSDKKDEKQSQSSEKKEWYEWSCPHCDYSATTNYKKGLEESIKEHTDLCPAPGHNVRMCEDNQFHFSPQSPCVHEWWKMKDMVFERVLPVEEKKEDPLKGIMTLQQYHELADLADNFMSKFKSVKDGSLSSKEREACKIVNL